MHILASLGYESSTDGPGCEAGLALGGLGKEVRRTFQVCPSLSSTTSADVQQLHHKCVIYFSYVITLCDLRIEETNTLSLGGLTGASDTLGAALYVVDFAMTMLKVWPSIGMRQSLPLWPCSPHQPSPAVSCRSELRPSTSTTRLVMLTPPSCYPGPAQRGVEHLYVERFLNSHHHEERKPMLWSESV